MKFLRKLNTFFLILIVLTVTIDILFYDITKGNKIITIFLGIFLVGSIVIEILLKVKNK